MGATTRLALGVFGPSPIARLAADAGHFAARGLEIEQVRVGSSVEQFRDLLAGRYDLVLTSPDNVLGYRYDPTNPLGGVHDVRILAAADRGLGLSVVGGPGVGDIAELRGGTVGVDAVRSGFAFALYRTLAAHGLERDRDYRAVPAGGTPRRRDALLDGAFTATLLYGGHDLAAIASGCRRLARVTDVVGPFLGTVVASTGRWVEQHGEPARAFLSGWLTAAAELVAPEGRPAALRLIAEQTGLAAPHVEAFHAVLTSPREGVVVDGRVDPAALAAVAALRAEAGGPGAVSASATDPLPGRLVDDHFLPMTSTTNRSRP